MHGDTGAAPRCQRADPFLVQAQPQPCSPINHLPCLHTDPEIHTVIQTLFPGLFSIPGAPIKHQIKDLQDLALKGLILHTSSLAPSDCPSWLSWPEDPERVAQSNLTNITYLWKGFGHLIRCLTTPLFKHFLKFLEAFTSGEGQSFTCHSPEQPFVWDFIGNKQGAGLPSLMYTYKFLKKHLKNCLYQLNCGNQNTQSTGQNQGEMHLTFKSYAASEREQQTHEAALSVELHITGNRD